jgi:hypothetical protein
MAARDAIGFALTAIGGLLLWRMVQDGGIVIDMPKAIGSGTGTRIEPRDDYAPLLRAAESSGKLYVKAPTSSGSGLYQFLKATWIKLGGEWGPDPSKAFGGLRPSRTVQDEMFRRLTDQNARALVAAGISVTNPTLYAAHFLGATTAVKVLRAQDHERVANLVGARVVAANKFLAPMTVRDFRAWLVRKMGA